MEKKITDSMDGQSDKVSLVTQYCVTENIQTCNTMEFTGIDTESDYM